MLGEEKSLEVKMYDINLSERVEKNLEKYGRTREVTEKWVTVLKKAIGYTTSKRASTDVHDSLLSNWQRKSNSGKFYRANLTSLNTNSM